jgi:hypothetical protein
MMACRALLLATLKLESHSRKKQLALCFLGVP